MRKYVLNIDRLYAGATANALILRQIDDEPPLLVPTFNGEDSDLISFKAKYKNLEGFNADDYTEDNINDYIVDFNTQIQQKFKSRGHQELYMVDDTWRMNSKIDSSQYAKTYMHCLNGIDNEDNPVSQLNVLFSFRKLTSKSPYAHMVSAVQLSNPDDMMERARRITIQGGVSYEKCVQSVAFVGNNMYVMTPNIDIGTSDVFANGLAIINSYFDRPFHFPNSLTLFQPGQDRHKYSNLDKFKQWYKRHSRHVVVNVMDEQSGNVSTLKCLGKGSYVIDLAFYSPTGLVVGGGDCIQLNQDTYRRIRSHEDSRNKYGEDGMYVFDVGYLDGVDDNQFADVGFAYNLYDNFISGKDRIVKIRIPRDADFNDLDLKFDWEVVQADGLNGTMEANILVDGKAKRDGKLGRGERGEWTVPITGAVLKDSEITLTVRIHFDVDFHKRNRNKEYVEWLRKSGVVISNIRVENGIDQPTNLTFGSYVNEPGISQETHDMRQKQFWEVCQYKRDVSYQTVLETSVKNIMSSGIMFRNNYSSGDLYGDVFVTKSVLDPRYNMNLSECIGQEDMLHAYARDYIGLGNCSDQLWLTYTPISMYMNDQNGELVWTKRVNPEPELKYQMVEVVKNINRFESSIKHKSNVFSVVVENSNLAPSKKKDKTPEDEKLEEYKARLRDSITQFVRNACRDIVPVHTQLFDVQFT